MTERNDHSEYLIVAVSFGPTEDSDQHIHTLRANRKETAEEIAGWLNGLSGTRARVFSDPPKIGQ